MIDDLSKPLGTVAPATRHTTLWTILILSAIAVPVVMAGGYFWLGSGTGDGSRQVPVAAQDESHTARGPVNTAETAEEPEMHSDNSSDTARLDEVEPRGNIQPVSTPPPMERQEPGLAHMPDERLSERISSGVIPKRSADNLRPMDAYSRPPATEGNFGVARVVLIVGGLGISQTGTQQAIQQLPPAVNLAFAPYGNSLQRWMEEARKRGHELLLQLPMEPFDYPASNPGRQTLLTGAGKVENIANLHWLMSRMTNYVGFINYLGGKYLADANAIKPVFDEIARRGLLFVDDGTIGSSRADEVAAKSLLPFAKADVRIDAIRERSKIADALRELAEQAKRTGTAIGYANAFPDSVSMIAQFAAQAENQGIEITPVSAIVRDPERQ